MDHSAATSPDDAFAAITERYERDALLPLMLQGRSGYFVLARAAAFLESHGSRAQLRRWVLLIEEIRAALLDDPVHSESAVIELARSDCPNERRYAAASLADFETARAYQCLLELRCDPHPEVRQAARVGIEMLLRDQGDVVDFVPVPRW